MASKYINGTYNAGYTLTAAYSVLTIGTLGSISGSGLVGRSNASYAITNLGRIAASNTGASGILLQAGGTITNGNTNDTAALIAGAIGSTGTSGTVGGVGGIGIKLSGGGRIGNSGTIAGGIGGAVAFSGGGGGSGIDLSGGGSIGNSGTITGGRGASPGGSPFGGGDGGAGAAGINLSGGGSIGNSGTITGGRGGDGLFGKFGGGSGGAGAAGINLSGGGSIGNSGTIIGGAGGSGGGSSVGGPGSGGAGAAGINLSGGGSIGNFGTIIGGAGGNVGHAGAIYGNGGAGGAGINLSGGGSIGNFGTIIGGAGGFLYGFPTVIAVGTVGAGIILSGGEVVTNGSAGATTALIQGGIGIQATGTIGATVTNYGRIIGSGGTAISLGTAGSDLIVIGSTASSLQGVVANLQIGDRFDLPFLPFSSSGTTTVVSNGTVSQQLQVVENGSTFTIALDPKQSFADSFFQLSPDSGAGTLVTEQAMCFCRGTLILTECGEVPVEALAVGDRVRTMSGALKPIVWIGVGRDLVTRANKLSRPVIVCAGALADGMPHRDLYLTHGHALYLDGVLIPVENLVNHRSILWDERARVVEYYHIELEDHDVVLADGAPAESYYDAGNRAHFHNTRPRSVAGKAEPTFVPVIDSGAVVERAWTRIFERAGGQIETAITGDPDLHLVVDGRRLDPAVLDGGVYRFLMPRPPAGEMLLRSRRFVPSLLGLGRSDHWPLGVAIIQLVLEQAGIATYFDCDQPQLSEGGCYPPQAGFCFTDGEFALPARFFPPLAGPAALLVHTEPRFRLRYPIAPPLANVA